MKCSTIKSPVDLTVGLCCEMNVVFPGDDSYSTLYGLWTNIQQTVPAWPGQNIGNPPDVSGWAAWYQKPLFDRTWINSERYPSAQRSAIAW